MRFTWKKSTLVVSMLLSLFLFALLPPVESSAATSDDSKMRLGTTSVFARVERLKRSAMTLLEPEHMNAAWVRGRIDELHVVPGDTFRGSTGDYMYDKSASENLVRLYRSYLALIADDTSYDIDGGQSVELPISPPYSIQYYDRLRQERGSILKRIDNSLLTLKLRADEATLRIDALRKSEYAIKTTRSNADRLSSKATYAALLYEEELDRAMLMICLARIDIELEYIERLQKPLAAINTSLDAVRADIVFSGDDLDDIISNLKNSIETRERRLDVATDRIDELNEEIFSLASGDRSLVMKGSDERRWRNEIYSYAWRSPLDARLALLTAREYALRCEGYVLSNEINILSNSIAFWKSRFDVISGNAAGNDFWQARREALLSIEDMGLEKDYATQNMEDIRFAARVLALSMSRVVADAPDEDEISAILRETMALLHDSVAETTESYESTIEDFRLLAEALIDETTKKLTVVRLSQRARESLANLRNTFMARVIWRTDNFEVTAYDITRALMVVVLGYFISVLISDILGKLVMKKSPKAKADVSFIKTVKKSVFMLCWISFFMLALDSINVPLTAFTFLGGSLAIAMGFGAQDLCKNLISGAIILFSRPFKSGDIVNVDDLIGIVGDIGPRSTTVTTFDDVEVFVPNSYFIANNVINYTKTTPVTRQFFPVSVSSECPIDRVERVLLDIIQDYKGKKSGEQPYITVSDISRDANTYMLYYWLDVKDNDDDTIKGKLRKEIVLRFAENDITLYQPEIYRMQ